jgi:hypothetical protein
LWDLRLGQIARVCFTVHTVDLPALADQVDVGERFTFLNTVMLARRGPIKTLRFVQVLQGLPQLPPGTADPKVPRAMIAPLDWNAILRAGTGWD